jgi:hypothetical protein
MSGVNAFISEDGKTVVGTVKASPSGDTMTCAWTDPGGMDSDGTFGKMQTLKSYIEKNIGVPGLTDSYVLGVVTDVSSDGRVILGAASFDSLPGMPSWVVVLNGHCELDWNGDGVVDMRDWSDPTTRGGYSDAWAAYSNSPDTYTFQNLFPEVVKSRLDGSESVSAARPTGSANCPIYGSTADAAHFYRQLTLYLSATDPYTTYEENFPASQCLPRSVD